MLQCFAALLHVKINIIKHEINGFQTLIQWWMWYRIEMPAIQIAVTIATIQIAFHGQFPIKQKGQAIAGINSSFN
jgi:hypothetical protein